MSQTIEEAQEAVPNLCQAISPIVFLQDEPAFSPRVLTRGADWPALLAHANTAHAAPALTNTSAPNPAILAAVGDGKINSNCALSMDGQTASPSPPANPDSDAVLAASFGGSYVNSDYVNSAKNSPTSLSNTLDLVVYISKLEAMHEVSEGELDAIARLTVILSHTNELKILELADAETNPPENHQYNGATPTFNAQPYPPHSPP